MDTYGLHASINAAGTSSSSCDTDTVFKNAAARRRPRLQQGGGKKKKAKKSSAREGEKEQSQAGWSRLHLLRLWQSKLELFQKRAKEETDGAAQSRQCQALNLLKVHLLYKKMEMIEIITVELLASSVGMVVKFAVSEVQL